MQQRTETWRAARLGMLTSTRADAILNGTKAARATLLAEVCAEYAVAYAKQGFQSAAMAEGIRREPEAKAYYELMHDCITVEGGFAVANWHSLIACSPDLRVGINQGVIEMKNPEPTAHMKMLITGEVDRKYEAQCDWHLLVLGCEWCDLLSYQPDMPASLKGFIKRFAAQDRNLEAKRAKALDFADEVEAALRKLNLWIT